MKLFKYIAVAVLALATTTGCTDLDETLYDQVGTQNYYNTKMDVVRAVFRPFEHGYWSIQNRFVINEYAGDQLVTVTRDGWWDDSGKWRIMHDHLYDVENGQNIEGEWSGCYQGIGQCNYVIEDMAKLSAEQFGFSQEEFNNLAAQCRALRAWFYIRLLDEFRNCVFVVSFNDQSLNTTKQVEPKVIFDFIESELKDCIELLSVKTSLGGNLNTQGQFSKAAAAAMLVRLYLNAQVYVGEDRTADCAKYAQAILDGTYGPYEVADRWDAPFDWNNETCDEIIFGFPGSKNTHWHYSGDMYWWSVPARFGYYANDLKAKEGGHNVKWACSPSYDNDGNLFSYKLGMTVQKFRKYPSDCRLKLYKNLGNSTREGMFIFGKLPYIDENGEQKFVMSPTQPYALNIRDAVGQFRDMPADQWPGGESKMENGDHNSGYHFAKYPYYSDDDEGQDQADFAEIRLPEVIYSLAECKLRNGDAPAAATLLNSVRKRYYPQSDWSEVLYAPEGKATLDIDEMLDEWGREFLAEGRRRVDLIRFGRFNEAWWDKAADPDQHSNIFPLMRNTLNANSDLVQNPGYNK